MIGQWAVVEWVEIVASSLISK